MVRCVRIGVVFGLEPLVLLAKSDVAEEEDTRWRVARSEAVVSGFGRHVGKVDALAEHVPGDRSLGRCDA